ncbi:MAG: multicopper oxidase domain-containing protein [Candidatus Eremiobacteraeota bacterium]|nr:multicopper oxidase domain-containing protein [Candidatus Eremiobacteraeota bacterium]
MNRRRFIVTSISAAAIGTALATDACSTTSGLRSILPGGSDLAGIESSAGYTLVAQYATTVIDGLTFRGRTYNGKTVGPTLVTRPGQKLSVRVVNKLPKNLPLAVPRPGTEAVPADEMDAMANAIPRGPTRPNTVIDPMNNPHNFNTTNLHTHGLQTVPHLFDPIGTSNPSAEMIQIQPGQSFQYDFPIPKDHPSGLHWYHPHSHGATDVQVSNGMAGLIVVRGPIDEVPEIKAAREIFMVCQTLDVNPKQTKNGVVYQREYIPYRSAQNGGYSLGTSNTMFTTNGQGVCWIDNTNKVYKPLALPRFTVAPGEIVRWRFLNGTNYWPMFLALPAFEAWIIAFDGVNVLESVPVDISGHGVTTITPETMFSAPAMLAHSANRIELLLQAPSKPGTYTMSTLASNGVRFKPLPKIDLAEFVVQGTPKSMKFPTKLPVPTREYPVIEDKDIKQRRKFTFQVGSNPSILTGVGFTINDIVYQMDQCETAPVVGTCEEWVIENAHTEAHPFHLHENSFQLVEINGKPLSTMEVWDTFTVPPKVGATNGSIRIRIRFVEWYGKTVFHCHILPHEDTGMMQNILMT